MLTPVDEIQDTVAHYWSKSEFIHDLLAAIPIDLFLALIVERASWMRVNRLFKFNAFSTFNEKIVRLIPNGSLYRIGVVTFYLLYVIHLDACVYYQAKVVSYFA